MITAENGKVKIEGTYDEVLSDAITTFIASVQVLEIKGQELWEMIDDTMRYEKLIASGMSKEEAKIIILGPEDEN